MKIYVLGSKGMLGRYVSTYLNDYYDVVNLSRDEVDASKVREEELRAKLHNLGIKKAAISLPFLCYFNICFFIFRLKIKIYNKSLIVYS